jgi:hypothetical protein
VGASARTYVLTGSAENLAVTRELGYTLIGLKQGRRRQAEAIVAGDRIVLYITRVMAFAASMRVTGELFEDRKPLWPGKPGKVDPYPWRFSCEPEWAPEESAWVPAETLVEELEHIGRWPREHWRLAFQGQIRPVSQHDAQLLCTRLAAAANVVAKA